MSILKELENKYNKEQVENMYKELKSTSKMSDVMNCSKQTVIRLMDLYSIKRNIKIGNKKHFFNESYFEVIDTEEKAYWLGFIMADGCVYIGTGNTKRLQINLKYDDVSHLNKFQKAIGSDYSIQRKRVSNSSVAILKINSTKMCNDLVSLGVIERKSIICKFPKIDRDLERHFIRGYFDGDGHVALNICDRVRKEFSIVGGDEMITSIGKKLNINKYSKKNSKVKIIAATSKKDLIYIHEYLYKDSTIYMNRKKKTYDLIIYMLNCPLME